MSRDTGVVAAKAVEILAILGHPRVTLAAEIGCHPRTVARWETGQHAPSRKNRAALRTLIGELLMAETAARRNAYSQARINRLEVAREALMTDADQAKRAEFEQEMRDRHARIVAERQQPNSVTYAVEDAFSVIDQDKDMLLSEALL
jgi:hypothetical protein